LRVFFDIYNKCYHYNVEICIYRSKIVTSPARKPLIAGNWKMHNTIEESLALARSVVSETKNNKGTDVMIAPSFTALGAVCKAIANSDIIIAAQDSHWEPEGAFTGAVSALQIKDAGATHVIIGHSERRNIFGETDETINEKLKTALGHGLAALLCIGEKLIHRQQKETENILSSQIKNGFENITKKEIENIIVAYEPVWAIGTGMTASGEEIQSAHKLIRNQISGLYSEETGQKIRILYGGSVKPENTGEIMACGDVDGVLVGGASLKAESFAKIINFKNIPK
jgi:triosephosphate isomerase